VRRADRVVPVETGGWKRATLIAALAVVAVAGLASCGGETTRPVAPTVRELLKLPDHVQEPYIPDYNPISAEKIALGRRLFYDKMLSGNRTQSCASCHRQELGFADGLTRPVGSTGQMLARNSQGLANVAYNATFTWGNNALLDLESQIHVPLQADNPIELGVLDGNRAEVLARFDADPVYQEMFADAFPDAPGPATLNKIVFALASFLRTMVSGNSAYDRYYNGDSSALTESQIRGLRHFNSERFECFHCHSGVNLSISYRDANTTPGTIIYPFFNNGLYNVGGSGDYPHGNQGLFEVTQNQDDRGMFRPQGMRNIALTAPYMHDGSIATLTDVVKHYARGGRLTESGPNAGDGRLSPLKSGLIRGFEANDEEIADVVAFLESLTDPVFLNNPDLSDPFLEEAGPRRPAP
jgi:cytochrome c peroxidase